jgi:selenide, water dikinase
MAPSAFAAAPDQPTVAPFKQLLVGTENSDAAAVWQVDDNTCIIATIDFFMPMVDDPYDFGRIVATNAISDVYAMGGKPTMALAMPVDKMPTEMARDARSGDALILTKPIGAGTHSAASACVRIPDSGNVERFVRDCLTPVVGKAVQSAPLASAW